MSHYKFLHSFTLMLERSNLYMEEKHCLFIFQAYLNLFNQGRLLRQNEFYAMDNARRRRQLMRVFLFDKLLLITTVYRKVSAFICDLCIRMLSQLFFILLIKLSKLLQCYGIKLFHVHAPVTQVRLPDITTALLYEFLNICLVSSHVFYYIKV